jgi:hypothetical protein
MEKKKLTRIALLITEISMNTTTITNSIHCIYKTILLAGSNYDHNTLHGKINVSVCKGKVVPVLNY